MQAFVSVSLIVAICMNLGGKRAKGELSAYSVFNKGFHQLPGSCNDGHLHVAILSVTIFNAGLRATDE